MRLETRCGSVRCNSRCKRPVSFSETGRSASLLSCRFVSGTMQEHFAEALVIGYEELIESLDLPDPDDRHVLAAAIQYGAQLR